MKTTKRRKEARTGTRSVKKVPRNRPKPNYLMLFAVFVASVAISGGISYALKTPALNVKEVNIRGVRYCGEDAVSGAAKPALGKNICLLRKSPIVARIRRLSEVEDVKIGRVFPDKVWIRVRERRACAVVSYGNSCCLVQSDGLVFHQVEGPVKGLPVISVSRECPLEVGRKSGSVDVGYALEALKLAGDKAIKVDKISVDHEGDMCLNMESDFFVKLGQPDDMAKKMSLLRRTLDCKPAFAREASYVDLSCPSAVVWKPRMTAQAAL
ncbi:MAG: FtsQ-type POTRA domain-containing protein [Armatimonadetes bacterium]|nr:FtsQ-type POTRA domain-containing protein [Armatimonadota bacterium]